MSRSVFLLALATLAACDEDVVVEDAPDVDADALERPVVGQLLIDVTGTGCTQITTARWECPVGTLASLASVVLDNLGEPVTKGVIQWQACFDGVNYTSSNACLVGSGTWDNIGERGPVGTGIGSTAVSGGLGYRYVYRAHGSGLRNGASDAVDIVGVVTG